MSLPHVTEEWRWYAEKLLPRHWERLAVVYVRQSTMPQVLEHQESTRLQYDLVQRVVAWGWPEARVLVIDEDLGRSGTSAEGRQGFQLLEICALFGTLIADLDGIYDPSPSNDRLL